MDKKRTIILFVVFLVAFTTLSFFLLNRETTPPQAACPHTDEIPFGPPALEDVVRHSTTIAKGKLEVTEDHYTVFRVSEPLKSKLLKKDEVIKLCQTNFDLANVDYGNEVIVFLKGKDFKRDAWSGSWQSYSTVHIDKNQIKIGEKSYSLENVHSAIEEQK
jgi:hypothetical protein